MENTIESFRKEINILENKIKDIIDEKSISIEIEDEIEKEFDLLFEKGTEILEKDMFKKFIQPENVLDELPVDEKISDRKVEEKVIALNKLANYNYANLIDINDDWNIYCRRAWHTIFEKQSKEIKEIFDKNTSNYLTIVSLLVALVTIIFANITQIQKDTDTIIITNLSILLAISTMFFMVKNLHGKTLKAFFKDAMNYLLMILITGFLITLIIFAK